MCVKSYVSEWEGPGGSPANCICFHSFQKLPLPTEQSCGLLPVGVLSRASHCWAAQPTQASPPVLSVLSAGSEAAESHPRLPFAAQGIMGLLRAEHKQEQDRAFRRPLRANKESVVQDGGWRPSKPNMGAGAQTQGFCQNSLCVLLPPEPPRQLC